MRMFLVAGVALVVGACSQPSQVAQNALTDAQIAAFAVESAYIVAARAERVAEPHLSADQLKTLKALDDTAYKWAKTLAAEAQAGQVIADDLKAGQDALGALNAALR